MNNSSARLGRIFCVISGIGGMIAVALFSLSQIFAFSRSLSNMPLTMILTVFGGEITSLLLFGLGFAFLAVTAIRSRADYKKGKIVLMFLDALVLTIFSVLALPTIGIFIMPMAVAGLVGGIILLISRS